jgi:hypothetical protein
MIRGTVHQKDITVLNIYVSKIRSPKDMKQILVEVKGY